jgi:putative peptidoglycan lipid II flippase
VSGATDARTPAEGSGERVVQRHRGLVGRTVVVSGLTLLSRLLGLVREVLSAALFGSASPIYDAFLTAWRVPNMFRRFLGEGALSTSLQTAMTAEDADHGDEAGRRLFVSTTRLVTWILLALCAVVMGLAAILPDVMPITGWSWLGTDPGPVRELTLRLFPYVVLICLTALAMGALQVRGHFFSGAFAPAVMNVVWIGALLLVGYEYGWRSDGDPRAPEAVARQLEMARALGWGVLVAGVVQLGVLVPALATKQLLPRPGAVARTTTTSRATAGAVLRTSLPLALGAAVYQINVMVDGLMAEGLLADGGPTAHYCANRIQQFPLALVAIAATSAVFPRLRALGHLGRKQELRSLHDGTQMAVSTLAIPASVGLFLFAGPISTVLFEHGAYGPDGTVRIAAALRMLSLALLPAGAVGLASRTYYALADFRTPVRISAAMLLVNVVLNLALVLGAGMDTDGLALATALTSWGNLALLLPGLRTRLELGPALPGVTRRLVRITAASLGAGGLALAAWWGAAALLGLEPDARDGSVLALLAGAVGGIAGYGALARALGLEEWRAFADRVRKRLGR